MRRHEQLQRVGRVAVILAVLGPVAAILILQGPVSPPAATASTGLPVGPIVTAVSPSTLSQGGGATVTITGDNLGSVSAVEFGPNQSSSVTAVSSSKVVAVAPVGSGAVHVRVVTPNGTSTQTVLDKVTYVSTGQVPVTAAGQHLDLAGTPTVFTGVNAYELATDWGTNAGCGGMETPAQINSLFTSLKPNSIVRFDVFQGTMATNTKTDALDWGPDRPGLLPGRAGPRLPDPGHRQPGRDL